jgi:glycosyltransferase involved in cell wall biosynthesis
MGESGDMEIDRQGSLVSAEKTDLLHVCFGGLGGHAGVVQPMTKELTKRGLRSTILLYAPPSELVNGSTSWRAVGGSVPIAKRGRVDLAGLSKIAKVVRQSRPRVVLCHGPDSVVATVFGQLLAGTTPRVALVEHQPIGLRSRANQVKTLLALPFIKGLVVLTDDYAIRYPYRALPFSAVRKMATIPNGIDLDLFKPKVCDRSWRSEDAEAQTTVIGMASRLTSTKDVATFFNAVPLLIAKLPDSHRVIVRIAGDGPERHRLEMLVDQLGLREVVQFCGTLDEQGVVQFLQDLDIYVHSTLGETLSTAMLQAYAVGLPIVASDVEGVRNLIRDGEDGLLVPGRAPEELAKCLLHLIGDTVRRTFLGANARIRAEAEFSASLMVDRYLNVFASIDPKGPWETVASTRND